MNKSVTFAVKTSESTIARLRAYCKKRGIKIGFFVEKAILDEIEQSELMEDSRDIVRLKHQESAAIPAEDYFAKRKI
jgi:hypothetical protein